MKSPFLIFFSILLSQVHLIGIAEDLPLSARIAEIKSRSRAHEYRIAALLSKPAIPPQNYEILENKRTIPLEGSIPVPPTNSEIPYIPLPEFYDSKENLSFDNEQESSTKAGSPKEALVPTSTSSSDSSIMDDNIDDAYADLYQSETSLRSTGYYFGPLVGVIIPDDGALRDSGSSIQPYTAENGYVIGFQLGKDFGTVRVEGEYSYMAFDGSDNISVGANNFLARIVLETELNDEFELRAGMAMGVGFIGIDGGSSGEPSDVGFAYDFLLGGGYNFNENWSLCFDYKYYLSAANDNYDRVKAHMLLLSANFQL